MKLTAFLEGIGIGALAMYFADPDRGARRRAMVRDQAVHQVSSKRDALNVMTRDFANRARGIQSEFSNRFENVPNLGELAHGNMDRVSELPTKAAAAVTDRWNPATCLVMAVGGMFVNIYGMGRKGMMGGLMQVTGAAMIGKAFYDTEHRFEPSSEGANLPSSGKRKRKEKPEDISMEGAPVTERGQAGMV
jgi:hypothetical protein